MAFRRNLWGFLNLRLFLVLESMFWHLPVMGSAPVIHFNAIVGGNVTLSCPFEKRTLNFLYLQKNLSFVNGFHTSRPLPRTWENTWMDKNTKAVHMYNVNVSHAGVYHCVMDYVGSPMEHHATIHLHITANYSKPEITVLSRDENHWRLKCSSHGGYPRSEIRWNIPEIQTIQDENTSNTKDPVTQTYNSSSIAQFNCSMGEIKPISCFVGDIESEEISACSPKDPTSPPIHYPSVIAVVCGVLLLGVLFAIFGAVLWKRNTAHSDTASEHAMANGDTRRNEQETPLSDVKAQS